jgi:hypothetical protein
MMPGCTSAGGLRAWKKSKSSKRTDNFPGFAYAVTQGNV